MGNIESIRHNAMRRNAIRHSQNQLLYGGLRFSALGTFILCPMLAYFSPFDSDLASQQSWLGVIAAAFLLRLIDNRLYLNANDQIENAQKWGLRFSVGAMLSTCAWASCLWFIFPSDNVSHQLLLVLTLSAFVCGSIATLPYDRMLILAVQVIILIAVELRFLSIGDPASIEIVLFSLFVFGFLLSCGKEVGTNYFELLHLKLDIIDKSRSAMQTTERMAHIGYWEWDGISPNIELSDNLAEIWKVEKRTVAIKECFLRLHVDDRKRVRKSFTIAREGDEDVVVEYRMRQNQPSDTFRNMRQVVKTITDASGNQGTLGTVQDITDIRSAEEKVYAMAYYDGLTGLANRGHFHEVLNKTIQSAREQGKRFSIIYIDLDNFKGVNDSFGHECGDSYLKAFSNHLKHIVRKTDLVARLGGDEFCILVNDVSDISDSVASAERCLQFGQSPLDIGNHRITPKLSVGISTYPTDGEEPDDIVKSADLAMYYVKNSGKQNYAIYDIHMTLDSKERKRFEADLKLALQNDEFELWYQPQMDIREDRYNGVEALIRWRHPVRGMIPPDQFIGTAERVGMIIDIGEWVLNTACKQVAQWNAMGIKTQMAVNISGDHFTMPGFSSFVEKEIESVGILPESIEIEITESLSRDPETHTRICKELQAIGVRVAIDDFGTGYSSLSLLGKLPVDTLKIDRSFISELPEDHSSRLMVKAIADLCIGFNYDVVAEGVETEEQLTFLKQLNIPYVQGYYFSKPVTADNILSILKDDRQDSKAA